MKNVHKEKGKCGKKKFKLKLCKKVIRNADLSIDTYEILQTIIWNDFDCYFVIWVRIQFEWAKNLSEAIESNEWDVVSIFRRSIRNGVIINLIHIDMKQFLDDTCWIFVNIIRKSDDCQIFSNKYFNQFDGYEQKYI